MYLGISTNSTTGLDRIRHIASSAVSRIWIKFILGLLICSVNGVSSLKTVLSLGFG